MLQSYLKQFESFEKSYPGPIRDSVSFQYGKYNNHIVFSCLIHGDEVGSLPAILRAIEKLAAHKIEYGGSVTFILGNKQAALKEKRYLETDLNRSFSNNSTKEHTHERKRALEIINILNKADVFFDFHQTNLPCKKPFYIFEMHQKSYMWARAIGASKIFVTRKRGIPYSSNGMCSDEYIRNLDKVGMTLELGKKGFHHDAEETCFKAIKKSLKCMDQVFLSKYEIKNLAKKCDNFVLLERTHVEPFTSPKKILKDGFFNLQKIDKKQHIGFDEHGAPFFSPQQGYILFPQYPKRNENGISIEENDPYIYSLVCKVENPKLFIS